MRPMHVAAGVAIFRAGEPSLAVYVIEQNEVAILVGDVTRQTEVARLHAGELFGESGVLDADARRDRDGDRRDDPSGELRRIIPARVRLGQQLHSDPAQGSLPSLTEYHAARHRSHGGQFVTPCDSPRTHRAW
jgi:CRP-like cAMP-binding protein